MEVINPGGNQICRSCGHANDPRAFFCSNCGARLGDGAGRPYGERPDFGRYRYDSNPERRAYYFDGLPLVSLLVTVAGFFVIGFIGPLIGVILGHISLRRMNRAGEQGNRGLAITSLIIGYFLLIVGLFILIALGLFVGAALFHSGLSDAFSTM